MNQNQLNQDDPSRRETNPEYRGDSMERDPSNKLLNSAVNELVRRLQEPEPWPEELLNTPDNESETPDIYTLFSALTALRQEISLQGRSLHQLEQTLERSIQQSAQIKILDEKVSAALQEIAQWRSLTDAAFAKTLTEERKKGIEEGKQEAFNSLVDPLLDTHDQLHRLMEQSRVRQEKQTGWKQMFSRQRSQTDFADTIELSYKKMSQRLSVLGVSTTARKGEEFDPTFMKAVEIISRDSCESHQVLEVYRQGYKKDNVILRFAEVKVAGPAGERSA